MRFHCTTVLVVLSICVLRGNVADDAMQVDVNKWLYPFYTAHVTVPITKKRFVGGNSQGYQYCDNSHSRLSADFSTQGISFSSKDCHDL